MVTVVGGPNVRTDYHDDPGDEFFYQLKGDMNLRIIEEGKPRDIPIREGEVLLLRRIRGVRLSAQPIPSA